MLSVTAAATPPPAPRAAAVEYVGFWMRLAAWFIDLVIIVIIWSVSAVLSVLAEHFYSGLAAPFGLMALLFPWLYYILLTGFRSQTVGKMAVGIKVVRDNGQVPGLGYAALRESVGKIASAIVLFLGFLWIAWDRRKRGWHDYIAGTHVVKTRR